MTAFRRATEGFLERAEKVAADQWSAPTPCTAWDIRALVNHIAGEYAWMPAMLSGQTIAEVGDRLDGARIGDDPLRRLSEPGHAASTPLLATVAL